MTDAAISNALPASHQPLRLFLVEDSVLLRDLMTESFSSIAGIVLSGFAETEDEAFKHIDDIGCDIVIVDIQLRQGNGIALLRRLSDRPDATEIVRVVLSNNVGPAYRRATAQIGPCFFFDKTAEFDELHQFLTKLGAGTDPRALAP